MIKKLIAAVAVLSFGAVFAGMSNEGTVYTIDCSGAESITAIPADATKVIKMGAGAATLCGASSATAVEIDIQSGTLVISNTTYLGVPTSLTIRNNAALHIADEPTSKEGVQLFPMNMTASVCGVGPDGNGAIVFARTYGWSSSGWNEGTPTYGLFYTMTLTGPTTLNGISEFSVGCAHDNSPTLDRQSHNHSGGTFNMGGYALTVKGKFGFGSTGAASKFIVTNSGDIELSQDSQLAFNSMDNNSVAGDSGKTIKLLGTSATIKQYMLRPDALGKWKLRVDENQTLNFDAQTNGSKGPTAWEGPWTINGNVVLKFKGTSNPIGDAKFRYKIAGKVSGSGSIVFDETGATHDLGLNIANTSDFSIGNFSVTMKTNQQMLVSSASMTVAGSAAFTNVLATISQPVRFGSLFATKTTAAGAACDLDFSSCSDFEVAGPITIDRATVKIPVPDNGSITLGDLTFLNGGSSLVMEGMTNELTIGALTLDGYTYPIRNLESVALGSVTVTHSGSGFQVENVKNLSVSGDASFSNGNSFIDLNGGNATFGGTATIVGLINMGISNVNELAFGALSLGCTTFKLLNINEVTINEPVQMTTGVWTLEDAGVVCALAPYKPNNNGLMGANASDVSISIGLSDSWKSNAIPALVVKGNTELRTGPGALVDPTATTTTGMIALAAHNSNKTWGILDIRDGAKVKSCVGIGNQGTRAYGSGAIYVSGEGSELYSPGQARCTFGDNGSYAFIGLDGGRMEFRNSTRKTLFARVGGRSCFVQHGGEFVRDGSVCCHRAVGKAVEDATFRILGGTFEATDSFILADESTADAYNVSSALTVGGGETVATVTVANTVIMRCSTNRLGHVDACVNLNRNGTLETKSISREKASGFSAWAGFDWSPGRLYVNFDGGTFKVKSGATNGTQIFSADGHQPTRVTVFEGGAVIDTNGKNVTADVSFDRPTGFGIDSVVLDPTETGAVKPFASVGATRLVVTGGSGEGASGLTEFDADTRTITGVCVTSPGFGYTEQETNSVEVKVERCDFNNGNYKAKAEFKELPTTGGFTKRGAGTLTMNATNTWGGTTRIEAGTLAFTHAQGLPANSTVEIASSAMAGGSVPLRVAAYTGGEIHIVGATLDDAWLQKPTKVLVSETALTPIPTVKLYGAGGTELDTDEWVLNLSSDGKALWFGREPTKDLTITNPDIVRGSIDVIGTFAVTNDEIVTVTATPINHALVGWNVDGEFAAAGDRLTYDYRANLSKDTLSLTPVFSTNLYVNATSGNDDSGDGMTPGTAKKTLAAIVTLAIPGDTIHAAPGTYDKGYSDVVTGYTPYIINCGASKFSNARVSLAEGVSLVADEGPAVTTIVGLADPVCEYTNNPTGGCGPSSLRCVVARANTYLKGFTIKDGYTRGLTGSITDANAGGCILAPDYDAAQRAGTLLVEDCRISNGNSRSGCCVAGGIYVRCVIKNGVSFSWSGPRIGYMARFIDCVLYQNSESMLQDPRGVYNTFAYSTGSLGEDFSGTSEDYPVVNSVVYTAGVNSGSTAKLKYFKNCYVQFMNNRVSLDEETCENCVTTNGLNYSVNFTMLGFNNAHDQPTGLLATSPLIDAGDSTLVPAECLTGDVDGLQRIWNGLVDIGPFEYAPTNEYTAAVCGRRATVTGASEMVATNATGAIDIPAGGSLSIDWKGREGTSKKVKLTVSALTEGSRLLVYKGDTPEATITVAGTVEVESAAALTNLRLVAEGGTATVSAIKPDLYGTLMILQ